MAHFLFVHGTFGRQSTWDITRASLHRLGAHTSDAFTLEGHDKTPLSTRSSVLSTLTDQLAERLTQPTILVGYSLGGRLAMHLLLYGNRRGVSDRIHGLVLESANPGMADERDRTLRAEIDAKRAENIRLTGLYPFLTTWYGAPLFGTLANDPLARERIAHEHSTHAYPEDIARIIEALSPGLLINLWPRLMRFPLPFCYVYGERDEKYATICARICALRPQTMCAGIPDAAHDTHRTHPDPFAMILDRFAQTLSPPA